jgi:alpha-amylase
MDRYPKLHWNLHATGILWRWLEDHHPEYLDRIQGHLKAGRVELLSGGFYEPILAVLPDRDKRFQIETMQRYLEDRFHVTPKGAWLAERVWEPHLTSVLADCGIQYTLLDDAHFLKAGLSRKELCGHFVTEEQGQVVHVFPIRQDLRYAIPFQDPGVTLNLLRSFVTPESNQSLVMVDDGEKFGLWPETYKHVYEDRWLDQFLTVLDANQDWLKTDKLETVYSTHLAKGRVYLPTTSYAEMGEWTLGFHAQQQSARLLQLAQQQSDQEELVPFVGGGYWRQFLTKYEEANRLHKKMIYVSAKVQQACQAKRVTAEQKKKMQMHLSAGQCNCGYWHGVFGGLYLPHLRTALYHELIEAETLADEVLGIFQMGMIL